MNASLPEVTETIADAASDILLHSFAVYRVEAATVAKIRAAHRTAAAFFRKTTIATSSAAPSDDVTVNNNNTTAFLERHRRVKNGNLYGYNVPLQSKELFRTWYESDPLFKAENNGSNKNSDQEEKQGLEYFRAQQPWPSNEFCAACFHLAKDLHRLLSRCLQQTIIQNESKKAIEHNDTSSAQDHSQKVRKLIPSVPPPRKRFRVSSNATHGPFDDKSDNGNRTNINNDCGGKTNTSLWSSLRPSFCPMDFFFYHNRIPNAVNCSEHVDRGALVVVCLTDVPGLEVRSLASQTPSFHCPEVLIHNENPYRERTDDLSCPGVVCIMAGDQLSRLLASSNAPDATTTTTTPRACVHRVRNPLKRARLSISYELRLDDV